MISKNEAQKILYSLKIGVVPNTNLDILCVGRDKEIEEFNNCMNFVEKGNGTIKFITGTYGSGKSFLLNVIKQKALSRNFVVARIQVDKSLKFNKIEQIYYQVMSNLSIFNKKNDGTSFDEMFQLWLDNLKNIHDNKKSGEIINNVIEEINNYNSSFASVFKSFIKAKAKDNTDLCRSISAWIKGEKNIPTSVKKQFNVKSDIDKDNVMSIFKGFTKIVKLIGYSGLVILVDEIELIVNERSDIRRSAYENIRMLVDMVNDGELKEVMFIFAGTNELFENEEKGIKTYAALYNRLSSSYKDSSKKYRDLRKTIIKIDGLNVESIEKLTQKIMEIHTFYYNWKIPSSRETIKQYVKLSCSKFGDNITQANCREYLKKLIDILDIMEQNPGVDIFLKEVNDLIERRDNIDNDENDYDLYVEDYDIDDELIEL
ncbi:hypothetical protein CLOACE_05350 [Clostridium acetireducens DSM 10703]|uniref:KAP family P-loop domain protein n=1 Tax=Clostridium acetireducens DSM 10703 TaxID=1121290 RepID=A0A1E8F120_9CLOT|nr:BREX system ATP-binding domain-containing protein [Clostridium acetireducens]OFI07130.1 hypothetical protein CLOACE_05350 [Clostridium acetireducens DSM 10703]